MADILFIQHENWESRFHPNLYGEGVEAPLPFIYIGSELEKSGFSVKIIDTRIENRWKDVILNEISSRPLFVGFSCMMGEQIKSLIRLSKFIKRHCAIPVVWGGVHPTFFPEQCLEKEYIDYVAMHDGEGVAVDLAQALRGEKSVSDIMGLAYKKGSKVFVNPERRDQTEMPVGAWHLVEKYIPRYLKSGKIGINTARGCVHRCSFCYNAVFNPKYKAKSPEKVAEEIDLLVERYGVKGISFADDDFFSDHGRAYKIAELIKARPYRIKIHINARIDDLNEENLLTMKEAGLDSVFIGIESGDQITLDDMNKDINTSEVFLAAKLAKKNGIKNIYSFVCGYPGEAPEKMKETFRMAYALHKIDPGSCANLEILTPCYGTKLYEKLEAEHKHAFPDKLDDWVFLSWKDAIHKPWIEKPSFYETLQLLFYVAFFSQEKYSRFPMSLFGLISVWARFRIRHSIFGFMWEFWIMRKIFNLIRRLS